ncbi:MAG TPA: ankyrin repeat domain-containing protein, partial [Candidatus Goldiibacteriota bacterium]|nr:ankyrin repeat domain-containing protein [Candidatus Goldiibacteriota bacterium]
MYGAAVSGWIEGVMFLLEKEIMPTGFILAEVAYTGSGDYFAVMKLLLETGINVDSPGRNDNTPLIEACFSGRYELAKYLISKGASINAKSLKGNTPLISAAKNGHKQVVKLLLKHGADTTPAGLSVMREPGLFSLYPGLVESNDAAGKTAAMMAKERGFFDIEIMIKEAEKAKPLSEKETKEINDREEMKNHKEPPKVINANAENWLVKKAKAGDLDGVKEMIKQGALNFNAAYDAAAECAVKHDQDKGRQVLTYLYEVMKSKRH